MKSLIESFGQSNHSDIAVETAHIRLTYGGLTERVKQLACWLLDKGIKSVSIHAQNSVDWLVVDLACQHAKVVFTPIPLFFSSAQTKRVLSSVKPDMMFSEQWGPDGQKTPCEHVSLNTYSLSHTESLQVPVGTSKVTYTSGSTGEPKGVCLSTESQLNLASSLVENIGIGYPRHLCLLPLPTLLENIAGIYAPLLAGGTVILLNDEQRGFAGSKLVNTRALLASIAQYSPNSLILVAELLQVLVQAAKQGWQPPGSLQFIAVGGSKIAPSLITEARRLNLPVYQGYGLSECCSVVSLCTATDDVESTGRLLPHIQARVQKGELLLTGNTFLGYLEDPDSWYQSEVKTGDLATLKDDVLYIEGRIKNTIISSFGRNIAPEWIESELLSTGLFYQAVVIGESKPFCTAILVPVRDTLSQTEITAQVAQINASLPDYAQIKLPIILAQPMPSGQEQGLYTENMRPKRVQIEQFFRDDIEHIYSTYPAQEL
jgi:long-subunit acyl-CoA synthetase (AMP-forming)